MGEKMKKGQIMFTGDRPMQFGDAVDQEGAVLSDTQQAFVDQVAATVKQYLQSVEGLLCRKYAHLKESAPVHLADRGNVLIVCCPDAVVIRFEQKAGEKRMFVGWMHDDVSHITALLSQGIIQSYADRNYTSTIPTTGALLELYKEDMSTGIKDAVFSARIGFDVVLERPEQFMPAPHKPFCLLSVQNALEVELLGELLPIDSPTEAGKRFLARNVMRLQVGWECIEVFPFTTVDQWKPEYAPIWAENDLLAAIAARQFSQAQFHSL